MKKLLFLSLTAIALFSCQPALNKAGLNADKFADVVDGKKTALYTLTNPNGMEVSITNFGGRIVSIIVPDKDGKQRDVVLGFDNVRDYETIPTDFGACIGRYANRIDHGQITIDGVKYQLLTNNYGHTLHGGPTGWQYQVYDAEQKADNVLRLRLVSPDGDNGFPGEVTAECVYTLRDDNSIEMNYSATTTATTVINMTNHSYFNLHGNGEKSVTDHLLWLNSKQMTPVDSTFMTTGEIADIQAGSPFDFLTKAKPIGQDIEADNEQLLNGHGYDHNWVLLPTNESMQLAATLYCPQTGIKLAVYTTEPGIQVYAGNFLDGTVKGKRGEVYGHRHAVCLETQKYPNSPNYPSWPSPLLKAGETYHSTTIFSFSCE